MCTINKTNIVNLTDKQKEEFVCAICLGILNQPLNTPCCLKSFCRECIHRWLEKESKCPVDRRQLYANQLTKCPLILTNLLDTIEVKCDFHAKGCKEILTIKYIKQHTQCCDFNPNKLCDICSAMIGDEIKGHQCVKNLLDKNRNLDNDLNMYRTANQTLMEKISELKISENNNVIIFLDNN
jgi:hypothetical protein